MDPVCNLKRDLPSSLDLCFLCQDVKKEKTQRLGERGKLKLQEAIEKRRKLRDHEEMEHDLCTTSPATLLLQAHITS